MEKTTAFGSVIPYCKLRGGKGLRLPPSDLKRKTELSFPANKYYGQQTSTATIETLPPRTSACFHPKHKLKSSTSQPFLIGHAVATYPYQEISNNKKHVPFQERPIMCMPSAAVFHSIRSDLSAGPWLPCARHKPQSPLQPHVSWLCRGQRAGSCPNFGAPLVAPAPLASACSGSAIRSGKAHSARCSPVHQSTRKRSPECVLHRQQGFSSDGSSSIH